MLWRRPSYHYGNGLVCEVSLQQLREDVQSDGQKSDVSVLSLGRCCETFRLDVEHAAGLPQNLGPEAVQNLLQGLSGQFETFIISFLVVGAFWMAHHRVFDKIKRYDQTLVWLNFVFLLFIVFSLSRPLLWSAPRALGFPSRFMHQTSLAQGLRSLWCGCTRPITFGSLTRAHPFAKSA